MTPTQAAAIAQVLDFYNPAHGVRVILICPICRNKRCPRAVDRNLRCTGSRYTTPTAGDPTP